MNVFDLLSSYRFEMTDGAVRLCSGDFFISLCFIIGAACAESEALSYRYRYLINLGGTARQPLFRVQKCVETSTYVEHS